MGERGKAALTEEGGLLGVGVCGDCPCHDCRGMGLGRGGAPGGVGVCPGGLGARRPPAAGGVSGRGKGLGGGGAPGLGENPGE